MHWENMQTPHEKGFEPGTVLLWVTVLIANHRAAQFESKGSEKQTET